MRATVSHPAIGYASYTQEWLRVCLCHIYAMRVEGLRYRRAGRGCNVHRDKVNLGLLSQIPFPLVDCCESHASFSDDYYDSECPVSRFHTRWHRWVETSVSEEAFTSIVRQKKTRAEAETEGFCVCRRREVRRQRTVKHLGLWFVTMDPTLKNPLHPSLDVDAQPLETFIETVTTGGAGSLLRYR